MKNEENGFDELLKSLQIDIGVDEPTPMSPDAESKIKSIRSCAHIRKTKNIYRKAFSETQLLEILPYELEDGFSYNVMSGGDIDSLSYLKHIIRLQDLDYCLFSTWCMESDDILQFEEWLDSGKIKRLDCYVGEIFPSTYSTHFIHLKNIIESKGNGGRVCVFRNHSKIYAGIGSRFAFGIQTSANINTNPRTENGCITVGMDQYLFYKDFFDKVISIKPWLPEWKPYEKQ